jgi:predicted acyl esterase
MFTHGRKKWETFYSEEALGWQKRFLDHFLRDIDNGMDQVPRVRLEVRRAFYRQEVRAEQSWPPASVCISARIRAACKENQSFPKVRCNIGPRVETEKPFFLSDSSRRLN